MMPVFGFIEFFDEFGIVDELLERADADEFAIVEIVIARTLHDFGIQIANFAVGDGLMRVGGDQWICSARFAARPRR